MQQVSILFFLLSFGSAFSQIPQNNTSTRNSELHQTQIKVSVYPNPTTGMTMVEADEVIQYITIIGSIGRAMCNAKMKIGNSQTMIDLTDYPVGKYQLLLEFDNGRTVKKRVVKE